MTIEKATTPEEIERLADSLMDVIANWAFDGDERHVMSSGVLTLLHFADSLRQRRTH